MSTIERERQQPTVSVVKINRISTTWGGVVQRIAHSNGTLREPGYGARLAVRKFGAALNKLAE